MKKLLTILGAVGLVATTGATVVACGNTKDEKEKTPDNRFEINTLSLIWEEDLNKDNYKTLAIEAIIKTLKEKGHESAAKDFKEPVISSKENQDLQVEITVVDNHKTLKGTAKVCVIPTKSISDFLSKK